MPLSGRVAVVTGGARGIGAATARRLGAAGATTLLLDRDPAAARHTAADLGATAIPCDVTSLRQVRAALDEACRTCGRLDILVNSAGIWRPTPVLSTPVSDWDAVFDVNVKGILRCAQAAAAHMVRRASGKIVTVASVAGFTGAGAWSAYCASKAAALSLSLALADALGDAGVQVHTVCPGATRTDMLRQIIAAEPGSRFDWVHDPEEVAGQVLDLLVPWEDTATGRVVTMKPVQTALGVPVR